MSEIINSCMKVEFSRREAIFTPTNNKPSIFGGDGRWWGLGGRGQEQRGEVKNGEGRSGVKVNSWVHNPLSEPCRKFKSPYLTHQDSSSDQRSATRTLTVV